MCVLVGVKREKEQCPTLHTLLVFTAEKKQLEDFCATRVCVYVCVRASVCEETLSEMLIDTAMRSKMFCRSIPAITGS